MPADPSSGEESARRVAVIGRSDPLVPGKGQRKDYASM